MKLEDFIKALQEHIPFELDFDFKAYGKIKGELTEIAPGISVDIFGGLTVGEKQIFDAAEQKSQTRSAKLRLEMKNLGAKFMDFMIKKCKEQEGLIEAGELTDEQVALAEKKISYLKIENVADAIGLVYTPRQTIDGLDDEEVAKRYIQLVISPEADDFAVRNTEATENIISLSKLTQTPAAFKFFLITIWLRSRFDPTWDIADTWSFSQDEYDAVEGYFDHEFHNGKPPVEIPVEEEELNDEESIKKT